MQGGAVAADHMQICAPMGDLIDAGAAAQPCLRLGGAAAAQGSA